MFYSYFEFECNPYNFNAIHLSLWQCKVQEWCIYYYTFTSISRGTIHLQILFEIQFMFPVFYLDFVHYIDIG